MRLFLLALVIALLPLRSWAADLMALQTAQQVLQQSQGAIKSVAGRARSMRPGDVFVPSSSHQHSHPCADHDHADDPSDTDPVVDTANATTTTTTTDSHCNACTSCQVCHSVALTALPPDLPLVPIQQAAPPACPGIRFASATLAAGFKPPIC